MVDAPIGPHPGNKLKMAVVKHGGRPARTGFLVLERYRDFTLVRLFPKTGKTHQIRVHLKHVGMPLAVDPLYNPPKPGTEPGVRLSQFKRDYRLTRGEEERPLIERLTLHAHRLTFANVDGARVTVEADLPKDFRALLNQLRRHSRR